MEEDDIKKELKDAIEEEHPEEKEENDIFATDADGKEPAEEDDWGSE